MPGQQKVRVLIVGWVVALAGCRDGGVAAASDETGAESGVVADDPDDSDDSDDPDGPDPDRDPEAPGLEDPPTTIDEAVLRRLDEAGLQPVVAGDTEWCRRLYADLVGRYPTAAEVDGECTGSLPADVAAKLQATDEYVATGLQRWRDRLGSGDRQLFWEDLVPVFDVVERMLRAEIDYRQFVVEASASPGLMGLDADPEGRAYRVYRVLFGRSATAARATDLARLTRIWEQREQPRASFGGIVQMTPRAYVVPGNCVQLGACETVLVPGGRIDFPDPPTSHPFSGIRYENLTEEQRASLGGLGEHLAEDPMLWEAAADEVLDRLTGWNDGGTVPRTVGRLMPEVRHLVLQHLLETKSIASAERLVIESLLYLQSNRVDDPDETDRPVWALGPLQMATAELLIDTVRGSAMAAGSCDPRTADDEQWARDIYGYFNGVYPPSPERVEAFAEHATELHEGQGNWRPLAEVTVVNPEDPSESEVLLTLEPDYLGLARLFGGCPGTEAPRLDALDGLSYAYGQEVAAQRICEGPEVVAWVEGSSETMSIADRVAAHLLSRPLTAAEHADIDASGCGEPDCEPDELARGLCVALLGTHEVLFY